MVYVPSCWGHEEAEVESAVQDAYQRDYLMFGFESWG
jgi:hypothetical protein